MSRPEDSSAAAPVTTAPIESVSQPNPATLGGRIDSTVGAIGGLDSEIKEITDAPQTFAQLDADAAFVERKIAANPIMISTQERVGEYQSDFDAALGNDEEFGQFTMSLQGVVPSYADRVGEMIDARRAASENLAAGAIPDYSAAQAIWNERIKPGIGIQVESDMTRLHVAFDSHPMATGQGQKAADNLAFHKGQLAEISGTRQELQARVDDPAIMQDLNTRRDAELGKLVGLSDEFNSDAHKDFLKQRAEDYKKEPRIVNDAARKDAAAYERENPDRLAKLMQGTLEKHADRVPQSDRDKVDKNVSEFTAKLKDENIEMPKQGMAEFRLGIKAVTSQLQADRPRAGYSPGQATSNPGPQTGDYPKEMGMAGLLKAGLQAATQSRAAAAHEKDPAFGVDQEQERESGKEKQPDTWFDLLKQMIDALLGTSLYEEKNKTSSPTAGHENGLHEKENGPQLSPEMVAFAQRIGAEIAKGIASTFTKDTAATQTTETTTSVVSSADQEIVSTVAPTSEEIAPTDEEIAHKEARAALESGLIDLGGDNEAESNTDDIEEAHGIESTEEEQDQTAGNEAEEEATIGKDEDGVSATALPDTKAAGPKGAVH